MGDAVSGYAACFGCDLLDVMRERELLDWFCCMILHRGDWDTDYEKLHDK